MAAMLKPIPETAMRGINTVVRQDGSEVHLDDITTAAEGQMLLDELDTAILSIEAQISGAASGDRQRDPDWQRRVGVALKRKRRLRPRLQQRIGELRKAERLAEARAALAAMSGDGQRKAFVLAAADLLDHEVVTEIWARARELRPASFAEGGCR